MAGTELSDPAKTWPALLAHRLELESECHAQAGIGNLQIMERILHQATQTPGDFFVINWTWIDRFDFVDAHSEQWHTLRPSLDHDRAPAYFRDLHSQYRDMLTNLCYVYTAIQCLSASKTPFFMTYMDDLLLENVEEQWHASRAVANLQGLVRPYLHDWGGMNFLDWSRSRGYPVSDKWHPLDQAHDAAAEFMFPAVQNFVASVR